MSLNPMTLVARARARALPDRTPRPGTVSARDFAASIGLDPRSSRALRDVLATQGLIDPALCALRPLTVAERLVGHDRPAYRALAAALRSVGPEQMNTPISVPGRPAPTRTPDGRDLLLASTPRTGNTIVRRLVTRLGWADRAVHGLADLDWDALPSPSIVQSHVGPDPDTLLLVEQRKLRVITTVRHPVDTLLSARAFARHSPESAYWPGGAALTGDQAPSDDEGFLRWATSDDAALLLSLSVEWVRCGRAFVVRYEDLVDDPQHTVERLAHALGVVPPADAAEAMRQETASLPTAHLTHGGPGARHGLDPSTAGAIHAAHRSVFEVLGYD